MLSFETMSQLCSSAAASTGGLALPAILLATGLTGSIVHCAPMCGPLVLAQVSDRLARLPPARLCELSRLGAAAQLPYHLGRITTYAALGALVALAGGWLIDIPWLGCLRAVFLLTAALYFMVTALARLGLLRTIPLARSPRMAVGALQQIAGRARALGSFPLGVALGFLPCGLVYAALGIAAATGRPLLGAFGMVVFGLGTVPTLVAVGLVGHAAATEVRRFTATVSPFLMLANAALLASLALASLIG